MYALPVGAIACIRDRIAFALAGEPDLAQVFIDSTIVHAHQHSSGAQKT
jgi:hypothetical protein